MHAEIHVILSLAVSREVTVHFLPFFGGGVGSFTGSSSSTSSGSFTIESIAVCQWCNLQGRKRNKTQHLDWSTIRWWYHSTHLIDMCTSMGTGGGGGVSSSGTSGPFLPFLSALFLPSATKTCETRTWSGTCSDSSRLGPHLCPSSCRLLSSLSFYHPKTEVFK